MRSIGRTRDSGEDGNEIEDAAPQLMPADVDAAAEVQRPAKPKPIADEDGFTLIQNGRRRSGELFVSIYF